MVAIDFYLEAILSKTLQNGSTLAINLEIVISRALITDSSNNNRILFIVQADPVPVVSHIHGFRKDMEIECLKYGAW